VRTHGDSPGGSTVESCIDTTSRPCCHLGTDTAVVKCGISTVLAPGESKNVPNVLVMGNARPFLADRDVSREARNNLGIAPYTVPTIRQIHISQTFVCNK
jgi:hypothetical protein